MYMTIKIGQIINTYYEDESGGITESPFIIINITKKNIFGLRCSSVENDDEKNYSSRNDILFHELESSDTPYITRVNIDSFEHIEGSDIISILADSNWKDFNRITHELLLIEWENTSYLNNQTIHDHIWKGLENFEVEWTI